MARNPVTAKSRDVVLARAGGMCEVCGFTPPNQIHHRRPRGMGSTKRLDSHTPPALLALCRKCHELCESRRDFARDRGWLVGQNNNPADVPLVYQGDWALLTDVGGVFRPPQGRGRCERCGFHVEKQKHREGCQVG